MLCLGINGVDGIFHDASASLVADGRIIASVEEERFNRKKHTTELPVAAIEFCLKRGGIQFSDIDVIGYGFEPTTLRQSLFSEIVSRFDCDPTQLHYMDQAASDVASVESRLRQRYQFGSQTNFHFVHHHLAHAASVYYVSGFERAGILTIDGSGDRESIALFRGCGSKLEKVHEFLVYPESLGYLYNAFADHLGLSWISGPGKLMGLAGYGKPDPEALRGIIDMADDPARPIRIDLSYFQYYKGLSGLPPKAVERFGPARAEGAELGQADFNLAASVQRVLELAILHVVRQIPRILADESNLCMSGGVALNVTTNRLIRDSGIFSSFFVTPPAYDGGTSLGCALLLDAKHSGRFAYRFDPYAGPDIESDYDVESALKSFGKSIVWEKLSEEQLIERAARALSEQHFVGWVQGRMEVGPRALGNRSILANPIPGDAKQRLNAGIKKREEFRPYAPSVLQEEASAWFDLADSPYMLFEATVHPHKRSTIPAVVHVDGSSRPQTVTLGSNPKFYRLLQRFNGITGVPLLLNTSFNQHGEPIVNRPEEAITVLLATELNDLFISNYHVRRNPNVKRVLEWVSIEGGGAWKADEIPSLFDLRKIESFNDGGLTAGTEPRVRTGPQQWFYAAGIRLNSKALKNTSQSILIRVTLVVEEGRIGLLFVQNDLTTTVGVPVERGVTGKEVSADILLAPVPDAGWLVVRNTASTGISSACRIKSVRAFQMKYGVP